LVGLLLAFANGALNRRHLAARASTEDSLSTLAVETNVLTPVAAIVEAPVDGSLA
jgi:hypothetical protein